MPLYAYDVHAQIFYLQHTSDSQDTETSVSSEAVSASDRGALESACIKEEDISSESNDEVSCW
jgi:hypothetical protein